MYHFDRGLSNKTEHYAKKYGDTVKMHLSFFFFFSLWNLEYKVDPSSPETGIHNEWLVNLMYATVESCSACSRPCLRLVWDPNEAIFLTDFHTFRSGDASEPRRSWRDSDVSAPVMEGVAGLAFPASPPLRQSHSRSIINVQRGVFFHFNNSSQMTLLKATGKKNFFNYLWWDVCLTDAFPFSLCSSWPCSDAVSPPAGEFLCNHFYRLACCYLELCTSWCWIVYGSVAHSAEQKAWSVAWSRKSLLSHCLFSPLC